MGFPFPPTSKSAEPSGLWESATLSHEATRGTIAGQREEQPDLQWHGAAGAENSHL
jgi:hypothetical protein